MRKMDFNSEKFINEIKNRPAIWNSRSVEYVDKMSRLKAWEELVNIYGPGLPKKDRKQLEKYLQKKWRNIRDNFVKTHRAMITNQGSLVKKKYPYVFYHNLLFLKDTVLIPMVENVPEGNEVKTVEANCNTSDIRKKWRRRNKSDSSDDQIEKETVEDSESVLERNYNTVDDDDRLFCLSLVKELKKVPEHLQIQAKLDILKVIRDAQYSDLPTTSWRDSALKSSEYESAYYCTSPFSMNAHCSEVPVGTSPETKDVIVKQELPVLRLSDNQVSDSD